MTNTQTGAPLDTLELDSPNKLQTLTENSLLPPNASDQQMPTSSSSTNLPQSAPSVVSPPLRDTASSTSDPSDSWMTCFNFKLDKGATGHFENYDICKIIGKSVKELGWPKAKAFPEILRPTRLYFDTKAYPPPKLERDGRLSENCPSFTKLKDDLRRESYRCGCPIVSNGVSGSRKYGMPCPNRVFMCSFKHRKYKDTREKIIRQNSTRLAVDGETTCKFRIVIAWDQYGFYLNQKSGCGRHNNHPKDAHKSLPMPSRLRSPEEKDKDNNHHLEDNDHGDDGGFGQDDRGGVSDDDGIDTRTVSARTSYKDIRKRGFDELNRLLDDVRASDSEKARELLCELDAFEDSMRKRCRAYLRQVEHSKASKASYTSPQVHNNLMASSTSQESQDCGLSTWHHPYSDSNPRKRHQGSNPCL